MRKWIPIVMILVCCGVYAMVVISMSRHRSSRAQEAREARKGPEEILGTPIPTAQAQPVIAVLNEFLSACAMGNHKQAMAFMSKSMRRDVDVEQFKKNTTMLGEGIVDPDSAIDIGGGQLAVLVTFPSRDASGYLLFVREKGNWRLNGTGPGPAKRPDEKAPAFVVPAIEVEAILQVFDKFVGALKNGDYEQAWALTLLAERDVSIEKFKGQTLGLAEATLEPLSATRVDEHVRLLGTMPSEDRDAYFFFKQEDGQWKLYDVESVKVSATPGE